MRRLYQASELQNVTAGTIEVTTKFDVTTLKFINVMCTPDRPIVDLSPYVGIGRYLYDDISGVVIDNSMLQLKVASTGYRIFTASLGN